MTSTRSEAAAAARIGVALALRKRAELLGLLRPCFARTEPWLQAGKYVSALAGELPRVNGWSIARHAGDLAPDKTQRLLNHAAWDTSVAMSVVRRFAVTGLEQARRRRRRGMTVGAVDETGQEKAGAATAGVKRQYMGCAGRVANWINTVHLSYVREGAGHALIGARQWIPREHIADPVTSLVTGLPPDLAFRTKGQLAIDIFTSAYADGIRFDFACGDEVYGACTQLREFFQEQGQAYVLRVASNFMITLPSGTRLTCKEAAKRLARDERRWEVRSAGKRSKGERWYARAWIATASPSPAGPTPPEDRRAGLPLLLRPGRAAADQGPTDPHGRAALASRGRFRVRRGLLRPGPVPGPPLHRDRPARRARHGCPGDLRRHRRAAARPDRYPGRATGHARPAAPRRTRATPLTIPEIKRLLAALTTRPPSPWHIIRWNAWIRRHQARARWFHKRTRLARDTEIAQLS